MDGGKVMVPIVGDIGKSGVLPLEREMHTALLESRGQNLLPETVIHRTCYNIADNK